jgi:hypothetical protein
MRLSPLKQGQHFVKDRRIEIGLGFLAFVIGSYLLWDAYDNRGKNMKFPLGSFMPF